MCLLVNAKKAAGAFSFAVAMLLLQRMLLLLIPLMPCFIMLQNDEYQV